MEDSPNSSVVTTTGPVYSVLVGWRCPIDRVVSGSKSVLHDSAARFRYEAEAAELTAFR